jgi:hypothetical protein
MRGTASRQCWLNHHRDEELSQKYSKPEKGKDILQPMFSNIWKWSGLGLNKQRSVADKFDAKVRGKR